MKKIALFSVLASILSCNSNQPSYKKCTETTFNFNKEASSQIVSSDNKDGEFVVNQSENKITIIDNLGKETVLTNDNGYSLTNEKVGDTLTIKYFPTDETPSEVLKFGTEYKFYN